MEYFQHHRSEKNRPWQETETISIDFVAQYEGEMLYMFQRTALVAYVLPNLDFLVLKEHAFSN
jgi:hypothetical protein